MERTIPIELDLDQLAAAGIPLAHEANGWYVKDKGPYASPEAALLAGITRLDRLFRGYRTRWEGQKREEWEDDGTWPALEQE
jgi:hypothetical protein